ncbi:serine hydrolase domain-containing protein [Rhodococcus sp. O3]|uniref:serine hydrolase domain-containing protein n=1 Tax=Rhodococcus sp. O3 TaxID=3404919 RepID=UPI003B674F15
MTDLIRTDALEATVLDVTVLEDAAADVCAAGIPGIFAEVRVGDDVWRGAAGVADLVTRAQVTPGMRHRVGSISKTFVAAAVLQLVERGAVELDAPIRRYLPNLVPGDRGDAITVRMLLDHTSGLADYLPTAYTSLAAFPVVARTSPRSIDDNRFTRFDPLDLIEMGVRAPAAAAPGTSPGRYSNTNYLLLCRLIELITGVSAEQHIDAAVIARADLADTGFPSGPEVDGPHSRLYESWFGMNPPLSDYSVFDMSWVGPAASLISTTADLNRFFAALLAGDIIGPEMLTQMQQTVPVVSFEGTIVDYGLGLHRKDVPGQGTFWGHDGSVWGGGAITMARADGKRQMTVAINRQRWSELDDSGRPTPHPIDRALDAFHRVAFGAEASMRNVEPPR